MCSYKFIAHVEHPACKILSQYTSKQSLVIGLPQLAKLMCSEKLIKHIPTEGGGQILLSKVQEAVCIDYHMLLIFAECLLQSPSTAAIGNTIRIEYSKCLISTA